MFPEIRGAFERALRGLARVVRDIEEVLFGGLYGKT